jgi:hypothetical protein
MSARIKAPETKLAEVEARGIRYQGVHQRAQEYKRGAMTTCDGSLWAAIRDVEAGEVPGKSTGWQLCARAGQNGKDAR